MLIAALCFAYYNWKAGRGDLRGATRVGIYCGVLNLIGWSFGAHHVASDAEQGLIGYALAHATYIFVEYWLIYLALEPWVRRYWPQTMITWSRVLAGKWRDPMVGRDLLFGTLLGVSTLLLITVYEYASLRGGAPVVGELGPQLLNGFRIFAGTISNQLFGDVSGSLMFFLTLFLVRLFVKKQWLVVGIWVIGWVGVRLMRQNFIDSRLLAIYTCLFWLALLTILVFIMLRLGFFALVVSAFILDSVVETYFTTDFTAWYGQSSLAAVILTAAIALVGCRLSLGSRPLFSPGALEKT